MSSSWADCTDFLNSFSPFVLISLFLSANNSVSMRTLMLLQQWSACLIRLGWFMRWDVRVGTAPVLWGADSRISLKQNAPSLCCSHIAFFSWCFVKVQVVHPYNSTDYCLEKFQFYFISEISLIWFGISPIVGNLMPNPVYTYILDIYELETYFVDNVFKRI